MNQDGPRETAAGLQRTKDGRPGNDRPEDASRQETAEQVVSASTPQDVTSVRAKNSGHGKKTADKWNQ